MYEGKWLQHKLRIVRLPGSQWIAELDKLTDEQRAEVEPWLREQARLIRARRRTQRGQPSSTPQTTGR